MSALNPDDFLPFPIDRAAQYVADGWLVSCPKCAGAALRKPYFVNAPDPKYQRLEWGCPACGHVFITKTADDVG